MNTRELKVYYTYLRDKQVPLIMLQGNWIRELDFEIGDKVVVEANKGEMFVRVVKATIDAVKKRKRRKV